MRGSFKMLPRALAPEFAVFTSLLGCFGLCYLRSRAPQTVVINWRAGVSGLGWDRAGTSQKPGVRGHKSANSCAGSAEMCPSALLMDPHHRADGMC